MEAYLDGIRKAGSSVGAVIEVVAEGVPPGLGAPIYGKLDADLAAALMSINAVKGVEIGEGFEAATLTGEANADEMRMGNDGRPIFLANHAGGILGGISTGQPVVARFAVKPTSSILNPRRTVTRYGEDAEIVTKGRHDPCVGIRAVPVGEAMVACVLADHLLRHRGQVGEPVAWPFSDGRVSQASSSDGRRPSRDRRKVTERDITRSRALAPLGRDDSSIGGHCIPPISALLKTSRVFIAAEAAPFYTHRMKLTDWLRSTGTTRSAFARAARLSPASITALCKDEPAWVSREAAARIATATAGAVTPNDFLGLENMGLESLGLEIQKVKTMNDTIRSRIDGGDRGFRAG